MGVLPAILSLIVAAAGWHYLFYSRAAQKLDGIEAAAVNHKRVRLRRVNGVNMLLLGVFFYIGNYNVEDSPPSRAYALVWFIVAVLLLMICALALADLRLTAKLRPATMTVNRAVFRWPWVILLAAQLCACGEKAQSDLPTAAMTIGDRTFTLEIAADEASRQWGLMRRDDMPARHGMIFVFPDEQPRNFWMRNTRFDLDIIFLAADGHIVSIKRMKAYDETDVPSDGAAKYAIELNAGAAEDAGVKAGQTLRVPADLRTYPAH